MSPINSFMDFVHVVGALSLTLCGFRIASLLFTDEEASISLDMARVGFAAVLLALAYGAWVK